jgi:hypothetical protein
LTLQEKSFCFEDTDKIIARAIGFNPLSSLNQAINKTKENYRATERKIVQYNLEDKTIYHDKLVAPAYRTYTSATQRVKKFDPTKHQIVAVLDSPRTSPSATLRQKTNSIDPVSRESLVRVDYDIREEINGRFEQDDALIRSISAKQSGTSYIDFTEDRHQEASQESLNTYPSGIQVEETRAAPLIQRLPRITHREVPTIDFSLITIQPNCIDDERKVNSRPDPVIQQNSDRDAGLDTRRLLETLQSPINHHRLTADSAVIFTSSGVCMTDEKEAIVQEAMATQRTYEAVNDRYDDADMRESRQYFSCLETDSQLRRLEERRFEHLDTLKTVQEIDPAIEDTVGRVVVVKSKTSISNRKFSHRYQSEDFQDKSLVGDISPNHENVAEITCQVKSVSRQLDKEESSNESLDDEVDLQQGSPFTEQFPISPEFAEMLYDHCYLPQLITERIPAVMHPVPSELASLLLASATCATPADSSVSESMATPQECPSPVITVEILVDRECVGLSLTNLS